MAGCSTPMPPIGPSPTRGGRRTSARSNAYSSAIPTLPRRSIACSRPRRRAGGVQEEVRTAGPRGEPARWLRLRVRPLGAATDARSAVWTVADVTRDRERQENVFQELQHAIDYLDHAPAGFFSVD